MRRQGSEPTSPLKGTGEQRDYVSYLLRLWRVTANGEETWRASLECPRTGERLGFADLEALCRYLRVETQQEGGDATRS
jgi:hypothetical protein